MDAELVILYTFFHSITGFDEVKRCIKQADCSEIRNTIRVRYNNSSNHITPVDLFFYFTNFCLHEILSNSREGRHLFGFSLLYSVSASLIVGTLFFLFHDPLFSFLNLPPNNWEILFIVFFISLISTSILNNITGLFRGLKLYSSTSIIASLPALLKLSLVAVFLILLKMLNFLTILLIFSISSLISLLAVILRYRKTMFTSISISFPRKEILFFGISIYILGLLGGLSQTIGKIIVSHNLGVTWQGYFDASLTVISLLSFAFASMSFYFNSRGNRK